MLQSSAYRTKRWRRSSSRSSSSSTMFDREALNAPALFCRCFLRGVLLPQIFLRYRIPGPFRIPINLHAPPPLAIKEKLHAIDASIDWFAIFRLARFVRGVDVGHRSKRIGLAAQLMLEKAMLQKIFSRAVFVVLGRHHRQGRFAFFRDAHCNQPRVFGKERLE